MSDKFKKDLEKLLKKNEDSVLANYIDNCLKDYELKNSKQEEVLENPFGVNLQPPVVNAPPQPIPANIGNKTTSGWSNPFGGTSWGV